MMTKMVMMMVKVVLMEIIMIKIDVYLFKLFREENCDDDGTVESFSTILEDIMAEWL